MVTLALLKKGSAKMPPYHPNTLTPQSPLSPKLRFRQNSPKTSSNNMKLTKRKLIPLLVFILSIFSILRLLKIAISTTSTTTSSSTSYPPSNHSNRRNSSVTLTQKETRFLANLVSQKAPCNLLVFGIEQEYYTELLYINSGGITLFLEDEPEKMSMIKNSTSVCKVEYSTLAKDAYKLLKNARKNKACWRLSYGLMIKKSKCKLALRNLPNEVYELKWDVVIVDGPCGHDPLCPGRMASIYTASLLARNGNGTNVVVHDVDRMIEKWFSWEFLCDQNLVSSKGSFWNFRIDVNSNATTFCPT